MRRFRLYIPVLAGVALVAGACSSSSSTTPPTSVSLSTTTTAGASTALPQGSGPVDVLYASSLEDLMNDSVNSAFHSATGYTVSGVSGDSGDLANEIKGKTIQGDVYISANPSKDQLLEGASNGNWVSWYAAFGTSPVMLAYNPKSSFASQFKTKPWYEVVTESGFRLGRTDPTTDPKGKLAQEALETAATTYNMPELKTLGTESSDVYSEATLVAELQSGQVDAGFFYGVEVAAAHLTNTVPLTGAGTGLDAVYTVTVLNNAAHAAAADAFLDYLFSSAGQALLKQNGITPTKPPTVSGTAPANLQAVLSGG